VCVCVCVCVCVSVQVGGCMCQCVGVCACTWGGGFFPQFLFSFSPPRERHTHSAVPVLVSYYILHNLMQQV